MPFTLRNLRDDLEDLGSRFDGAPDLEFRLATDALELEKSTYSTASTNATDTPRSHLPPDLDQAPGDYHAPRGHDHRRPRDHLHR